MNRYVVFQDKMSVEVGSIRRDETNVRKDFRYAKSIDLGQIQCGKARSG